MDPRRDRHIPPLTYTCGYLDPTHTAEDLIMAELPWFAWIAIVAIIVWGAVAAIGSITGRPHSAGARKRDQEIEDLTRRVEQLEAQQYRRNY